MNAKFQVGKYLASQSDDKSVRVWRTSDWMQEAVITEPFAKCGGISFYIHYYKVLVNIQTLILFILIL